jgi:hypothetical protein
LQGGAETVGHRLEAFWDDTSANSLSDYLFNTWAVLSYRGGDLRKVDEQVSSVR